MKVKIFGQEPAALIGVVEAGLALLLALHVFGLTAHTVALIMAVVTAGFGLAAAAMTRDRLLSAIVGFAKAAIAVAVGYGLPLTDVQTSAVIAFVTVTAGLFVRTQTASLETKLSRASAGARTVPSGQLEGRLDAAVRRGVERGRGESGAINIDPSGLLGLALFTLVVVVIVLLLV